MKEKNVVDFGFSEMREFGKGKIMNYVFDDFIEELSAIYNEEPVEKLISEGIPVSYTFERHRIGITRDAIFCAITNNNTGENQQFYFEDQNWSTKAKEFLGLDCS